MNGDVPCNLVVCLHGLGRTVRCFRRLRRHLERAGWATAGWTYPSFGRDIEWLALDCCERLAAIAGDERVGRMHVVTHSLGGIILRRALTAAVPAKLGRVVMLAPPNRGSAWARRLGPRLGRWVPALPQLSDVADSYVNLLPPLPPGIPVAIIAAARDGKCPPPVTHLPGTTPGTPDTPGEAAHIIVPGRHTFIMYRRDVAEAVERFLRGTMTANG